MSDSTQNPRPLALATLAPRSALRSQVLAAARSETALAARVASGERFARLRAAYDRWLEPAGAILLGLLQLGSALATVLR